MHDEFIWGIFVVENAGSFPNFFPIAIYSTREKALENIDSLPKDTNYQVLKLPLNCNFAYFHKKTGKLVGMDNIYHEHFHFKNNNEE